MQFRMLKTRAAKLRENFLIIESPYPPHLSELHTHTHTHTHTYTHRGEGDTLQDVAMRPAFFGPIIGFQRRDLSRAVEKLLRAGTRHFVARAEKKKRKQSLPATSGVHGRGRGRF